MTTPEASTSALTTDQPNPDAPPELKLFAFLIGVWKCEGKVKEDDGQWQSFAADWVGSYILEGNAIADEFKATLPVLFFFFGSQRAFQPDAAIELKNKGGCFASMGKLLERACLPIGTRLLQ